MSNFKKLQNLTRVPTLFKKQIRRASKTTFIYPNNMAIRVVKDDLHNELLGKFDYLYSTSANLSGEQYNEDFAKSSADIIIEPKEGFCEKKASKIFKISKSKIKRVR